MQSKPNSLLTGTYVDISDTGFDFDKSANC